MNIKIQAAKNLSSNWLALGLTIAVGFFLAPYIIHHLGDDAYGLWIIVYSVTGSYGLFDLGIRSSVVRYVAKFNAVDEREELSKLISTSLVSYFCIGLFSLVVTILGYCYIDSLFHVSPAFRNTARQLFLMVGVATSLDFPLGVSGGILEGLQRLYWLNMTRIASTLGRAVLIVILLRHGYGLLMVAFVTVSLPIISSVVRTIIAYKALRLPLGMRYVNRVTFKSIARYSSVMMVIMLAGRLRFQTDALVIGAFMSAGAVTLFTIGSRIVSYATDITQSLAEIFTPIVSHLEAMDNSIAIRKIFVFGNQACALVMFPIATVLLVLGKNIIRVWVGEKYIATGFPVLVILLLPSALWAAQGTSTKILFGMSKHRVLAVATILEGLANVGLSILMVRRWGIIGDAYGTAIPLACDAVFLPFYLCHLLGMSVKQFLWDAYRTPVLLTLPLVVTMMLARSWMSVHNYIQLAFQIALGGLVYCIGAIWLLARGETLGFNLKTLISQRFRPTSN